MIKLCCVRLNKCNLFTSKQWDVFHKDASFRSLVLAHIDPQSALPWSLMPPLLHILNHNNQIFTRTNDFRSKIVTVVGCATVNPPIFKLGTRRRCTMILTLRLPCLQRKILQHTLNSKLGGSWLIDWLECVRVLTVPKHLGLINRPFVPHNLIQVQWSPFPC